MYIYETTLQGIVVGIQPDILTVQTRPERSALVPVNANKYYVLTHIQEHLVLAMQKAVECVQMACGFLFTAGYVVLAEGVYEQETHFWCPISATHRTVASHSVISNLCLEDSLI